jgi:DNA-binding LacI/PurR family transcriptional regulator
MTRNRPTIRDITAHAGVSAQTVSRGINGKGEISDNTRQHVQRVIDDLGYRRSAGARSLASQRTHALGLVAHYAIGGLFRDAIHAAAEEPSYVKLLLERRVEGCAYQMTSASSASTTGSHCTPTRR